MKRILTGLKNIFITPTPMYIIFYVTSRCNARCKMCFNWKNVENAASKKELELNEIKKILGNFSGIQQLTIGGGEPFLRNDLPEILEFASRRNDVQSITIPTNGILTDRIFTQTEKILNGIRKTSHLRVSLSVEGIGEKHDEIVQVKGAFENIRNTYARLHPLVDLYKNFNLDIALCCSAFNKNNLKELIEYCNENFKDCSIDLILARGDTKEKTSKNVTPGEYQKILDHLYRLKNTKKENKPFANVINAISRIINDQVIQILRTRKMPGRCYSYSKMILIQDDGDVFPCEYLNEKLGNLRNNGYDIKRILRNKNNRKIKDLIRDGKCHCTWECALVNNIVCNPRTYPWLLFRIIKDTLRKTSSR